MLNFAIYDEVQELAHISNSLAKYKEIRQVSLQFSLFSSSTELLETLQKRCFDILLLDILLPGINGIEIARTIREYDQNIKIIFITSSTEYAVDSYSVNAYYYLLKPLSEAKLFPILDRLFAEVPQKGPSLLITTSTGSLRIIFHKLEYLEVMNKKLYFHHIDGKIKELYGSLSDYEGKLLERREFVKTHRSYIVNMENIQELNSGMIKTISGQIIPISRLLYPQVKEVYMNYVFQEKRIE